MSLKKRYLPDIRYLECFTSTASCAVRVKPESQFSRVLAIQDVKLATKNDLGQNTMTEKWLSKVSAEKATTPAP